MFYLVSSNIIDQMIKINYSPIFLIETGEEVHWNLEDE